MFLIRVTTCGKKKLEKFEKISRNFFVKFLKISGRERDEKKAVYFHKIRKTSVEGLSLPSSFPLPTLAFPLPLPTYS
jgi:hypothetical protein